MNNIPSILIETIKEIVISDKDDLLKERWMFLAGITRQEMQNGPYFLQVEIGFHEEPEFLWEVKKYGSFTNSNKTYRYDPEDLKIPVKAHYHIYLPKSKKELYAVNLDGTAHHKRNRGCRTSHSPLFC